ncbi:MAG TPA: cysteine desulfurase [Candidatus Thermoplasmatota archaeon]|nr:cysteine desulfurase [Candidatus Thermoplasmatota archaeon]
MRPEDLRALVPLLAPHTYLDSASTSLKPAPVLDAVRAYYETLGANVDRGAHGLGSEATEAYARARAQVAQRLLGAPADELVLTRNATEALNLLAWALGREAVDGAPVLAWRPRDVILTTIFEHHSNLLPWQRLARDAGAELRVLRPRGAALDPADFAMRAQVRVVALQHASNVTGHLHDVRAIAARVRREHPGALVVVDGAQAAGHTPVDVGALGVDAYAFAGHKGPLGPQGTGGLWVRRPLLDRLPPFLLGGGTVADVQEHRHVLRAEAHRRLEGGTPDVGGAVGLAEGARLVAEVIGLDRVHAHERALAAQLREGLQGLGAQLVGPSDVGVVSFNLPGWGCHDLALALDKERIAVRSGHHCALPLARFLGTLDASGGTVRASFHYYNTAEDVERLLGALRGLAR